MIRKSTEEPLAAGSRRGRGGGGLGLVTLSPHVIMLFRGNYVVMMSIE